MFFFSKFFKKCEWVTMEKCIWLYTMKILNEIFQKWCKMFIKMSNKHQSKKIASKKPHFRGISYKKPHKNSGLLAQNSKSMLETHVMENRFIDFFWSKNWIRPSKNSSYHLDKRKPPKMEIRISHSKHKTFTQHKRPPVDLEGPKNNVSKNL